MRLRAVSSAGISLLATAALVAAPASARGPRAGGASAPTDAGGSATATPAPGAPAGPGLAGGSQYGTAPIPQLTVPGTVARILPSGLAAAPADAPLAVQRAIWAGNDLIGKPYIYAGGHRRFKSPGYDCSGSVSYALHGAALLSTPLDSSRFASWGVAGAGTWMTVFTEPEHAYLTVAGIRLDTSSADDPSGKQGPRWRPLRRSDRGYVKRHSALY